jgi:catechol 2,3-dioxygenase-like lactoylglutathione lyase family enzyme
MVWSGISGVHHAALERKNFDATLAFCTGVLGLKRKALWNVAPNRMALLDPGGAGNVTGGSEGAARFNKGT